MEGRDESAETVLPVHVDDVELVKGLRAGDEAAFRALLDRHHETMVRVALVHVSSPESAEDVVQDALLAVVNGIDRFELRSSLRTWLLRIVVNRAKSRGERDQRDRTVSLDDGLDRGAGPPEAGRFHESGRWSGYWRVPPSGISSPSLPSSPLRRGTASPRLLLGCPRGNAA